MSPEPVPSSTAPSNTKPKPVEGTTTTTIEESLALAKRAFALKKYEQAVDHYATALELMTDKYGEESPEIAEVYFAYGKALLENAITQSSVLGKEQTEGAIPTESGSSSGAFLSFSGDAEESEDEGEDVPVDLFGNAAKAEEAEGHEDEEEGEEVEPEDDFNAAWEVLDLARAIFEKQQEESDEMKLRLAETYITLGDVSLETEKFEQAITDYSTGLDLKLSLLPQSSRQIAEAHYKLSIVLDLSSGRLSEAIEHAEKALDSVEARLAELRNGLSGQMAVAAVAVAEPESEPEPSASSNSKGKGKATGPRLLGDDAIQSLSKSQMESEVKELEGLKEDLGLKVEELKTVPNEPGESAPALVAKALDAELNVASSSVTATVTSMQVQVNDLTAIVKKKKKAPEVPVDGEVIPSGTGKRKAGEEAPSSPSEKKARLGEAQS
ncbi:unnamed protein product [Somion occarium]|uniref:Tetratricopeptide SHNi-TPR domain-containing protein n=1 Tax=Somion occarium TaxID=3059160 RepID=A0ABP1E5L5_9APHY